MTNSFAPVESHLNATTTKTTTANKILAARMHLQVCKRYVIENWFANMQNTQSKYQYFSMFVCTCLKVVA